MYLNGEMDCWASYFSFSLQIVSTSRYSHYIQIMKRVVTHLLFWTIILFWTSAIYDYNGKYGWHFVWFNAIRLPLLIAATYVVIYYFLPRWLIREKAYLKFALAFGFELYNCYAFRSTHNWLKSDRHDFERYWPHLSIF